MESHQRFRTKYDLPLILLADPEHQALEAYGVWQKRVRDGKTSMGVERSTFIIDEEGILVAEKRQVQVDGHVAEMLEAIC